MRADGKEARRRERARARMGGDMLLGKAGAAHQDKARGEIVEAVI